MREELLIKLREITPEEQSYLEGRRDVQAELYYGAESGRVDVGHLLERGRLVTVRPHSRFIDFPEHGHNYVEIMYVCEGHITHGIGGQELTMEAGDLLLLNQQVRHGVRRAGREDIGINFIALPEFFDVPFGMLRERSAIADFLLSVLQRENAPAQYLLFRLGGEPDIENLMENMVRSLLEENPNRDVINQYSMGLVFLYLLEHMDSLTQNSVRDYREVLVQAVRCYIDTWYRDATLTEIAGQLHQSLSSLSRLIREESGCTFQEILMRKRFEKAAEYLAGTDMAVEEIAAAVGYGNLSFFYRQFQERYKMTPRKYRISQRSQML